MRLVPFVAAPLLAACGGSSDDPAGPGDGGGNQTASAVATPASATIARGAATATTVVFSATGGLTIGGSFHINRQYSGIAVTQTSTQTSGGTITKAYTISADGTVPVGTHAVRFSTPVAGYTGNGAAPVSSATFTLTVTQ